MIDGSLQGATIRTDTNDCTRTSASRLPSIHRLPMDTDLPGDFRFAQAPLEERRRFESPRLERIEIPPHPHRIPHAGRIAQPDRLVTILRGTQ